jgi:arginase family enzyme
VGVSDYANPEYLALRARDAGYKVVPRLRLLDNMEETLEAVDCFSSEGLENYYVSIDVDHHYI